jgi:hypothetical protein
MQRANQRERIWTNKKSSCRFQKGGWVGSYVREELTPGGSHVLAESLFPLLQMVVEIELHSNNINREDGFYFSMSWRPLCNLREDSTLVRILSL